MENQEILENICRTKYNYTDFLDIEICTLILTELYNMKKTERYIDEFMLLYFKKFEDLETYMFNPLIKLIIYFEQNVHNKKEISDLVITSSSGSSFVVIGYNLVWQYYKDINVKNIICNFYSNIKNNTNFTYNNEQKNIFDYIVELYFSSCEDEIEPENILNNIIIWKKIKTFNELNKNNPDFIENNKQKLKDDIIIALTGLHSKGYAHGDSVLDNIGYNGINFVLFDFDSIKQTNNRNLFRNDIAMFNTSCKNRGII